jgi:ADP-ribosyl-[dinitrogen reductase] hydrolase
MEKERNSDSHPIKIDFVNYKWAGSSARLGITFAPGKKQKNAMTGSWNRDLIKDVERIASFYKISTLVSMVEHLEMK